MIIMSKYSVVTGVVLNVSGVGHSEGNCFCPGIKEVEVWVYGRGYVVFQSVTGCVDILAYHEGG